MPYVNAEDMVPGKTYRITADGPYGMEGTAITVFATASFAPEATTYVPFNDPEIGHLMHVQYDAWGYPFLESVVFSPFDVVIPLD